MKINVILTLLIITLLAIAIISGCGGGSGTTQPASLVTPTPDYTDTGSGDTAYITVRVKWPEQGKTGNMRTVAENGKELTTSMIPPGTKIIDIYVIDYTGDPNDPNVPWSKVVAAGNIHEGEIEKTIPVYVTKVIGKPTPGAPNQGSTGPPPAIRVKILAEAFNDFDETHPTSRPGRQVARTDPNTAPLRDLKVGNQEADIFLFPDLEFMMSATESKTGRSIIASDTGSSNEYDIKTNLQLMYGTPFPVSTVIPDPSGKTSEPLEGQEIKFKIIQGSGQLDSTQAQTDPNGDCKVHFTTTSAYNVIEASYQYDPDDPNTIVTSQCTIGDNYELKVEPTQVIIYLPPQFKHNANVFGGETPVPVDTPTPNYVNITAKLNIVYPTPAPNSTATPKPPKPAEGKLIKFEIINGNDEGTYLSLAGETGSIVSGFTLADGTSTATLITNTMEYKIIKIKASFQVDSNDPNSIYSDYCNITVMEPPTPTPLPPEPTFTPTPTLTPTITPTPTQTPTPPPFPAYVLGTWNEITSDVKSTGNTFTVEFTEPYTYTKYQTKVKITKNGDTNNVCYAWVWPGDDNLTQMVWNYEEPNIIMPNGQRYKTCFGIVRHYMKLVPGSSSTICWALLGNGTYMCYWSK